MSISRIASFLIGAALSATLATNARAQFTLPYQGGGSDLQFFAPADVFEYGGEPRATTGWFATYDRLYWWISRPNQEVNDTQMDSTWGNRYNIGFMNEENHGWFMSITHVDGPNAANILAHERIDQWVDTSNQQGGGGGGGGGGGNQTTLVVFPSTGRNEAESNERIFYENNSLNQADLLNVEVNKSIRLAPFHNGGFLEPFIGAKYLRFIDYTETGAYARFDANGVPIDISTLTNARIEDITVDRTMTTNNMAGGQLGLRYFQQRNSWKLNGEFRAFALQNFVDYERQVDNVIVLFNQVGTQGGGGGGGGGAGTAPTVNQYSRSVTYDHGSEFAFGMEARAEAAYQCTRDIALNFGFSFMDIGKGVLRGADFTQHGEDVVMCGINFGVTVNR